MCVHCMFTNMWRSEVNVRCLPQSLSILLFETEFFIEPQTHPIQLDWLPCKAQRDPPAFIGVTDAYCHTQNFR